MKPETIAQGRVKTPMAQDPVCGMEFSEQHTGAVGEYNGKTYYFCSTICRKQFDLKPERYAGESLGSRGGA